MDPSLDNCMEYAKKLFVLASNEESASKYELFVETLLSLIGELILQKNEIGDIIKNLDDAYYRFRGELPNETKDELLVYFKNPVIKVNKETGEIVEEYNSLIDVCKEMKIKPNIVGDLKLDKTICSDNMYNWIIC